MKKKTCPDCKENKKLNKFGKNKSRKDGRQVYCLPCMKVRTINSYHKHKKSYFARAKRRDKKIDEIIVERKSVPCMDCGVKYPPYVMDFDHRNPKEKFLNICQMRKRRMAIKKILEEMAKCDVVCANCHRERSNKQNPARYTK